MAKTALTVSIRADGIREAVRAFNRLPKQANQELRDKTLELMTVLANKAKADGLSDAAPQSPDVASTVKAIRDRTPTIQAGGTARLGRNRVPAYKLLFGSVFGSNRYRQFHRPHAGRNAYWFFPIVEEEGPRIAKAWQDVADEIVRKFSESA